MMEIVIEILLKHSYLILFIGMLFAGESFFLPALFLALHGELNMWYVFTIAVMSTVISDSFWYYLGSHFPYSRISTWPILKNKQETVNFIEELFDKYGYWMIFISKFVYGARMLAQILAGVHRISFWRYIAVNTAGAISFLISLTIIISSVEASLYRVENVTVKIIVGITAIVFLVVAFHYVMKKWIKRELQQ